MEKFGKYLGNFWELYRKISKIVSKNFEINFKRFLKVFWKISENFKKYFGNFRNIQKLFGKISRINSFWTKIILKNLEKNGKTLSNISRSFEKYYWNFWELFKKFFKKSFSKFQGLLRRIWIPYTKVSGSIYLSLPRVELGGSKDWYV